MFKKEKKKKISIDFNLDNYEKLTSYGENYGLSNSVIVNFLIENFLDLDSNLKQGLSTYVYKKKNNLENSLFECSGFEKVQVKKEIQILENLIMFFTDGKGYKEEECTMNNNQHMQKVKMKNGYLVCPEDWIVVNNHNPLGCEYAGVVETKNGAKYNVPHFVFFFPAEINNMTELDIERVNDKCIDAYYDFKRILGMEVSPAFDKNHKLLNAEAWMNSPHPGYFPIPVYGGSDSYLYGAMVVRNEKE